jgi:hypothetical protein
VDATILSEGRKAHPEAIRADGCADLFNDFQEETGSVLL